MSSRKTASIGTAGMLLAGLMLALSTAAPTQAFRTPRSTGHMRPAVGLGVHPQATAPDQSGTFSCQSPSATYHCYGPSQIRTAYDIQPLINAGQDGSGQVIAIVDSFQNPTMATDLARFDASFGLPAPPSFETIAPLGLTPFDSSDPNQVGWSSEIALDVEWAHAIAPRAKILLALAPSDSDADQLAVERYLVEHRTVSVISMSFGEAESCMNPSVQQQEHALYRTATSHGITLLASTGDQGAAQLTCDFSAVGGKAVSIPASDPNVTAIGGTDLRANLKTGIYVHESVWNEFALGGGAGGGGFSTLYARPEFQDGSTGNAAMRGLPDVSLTASDRYGLFVVWGSSGSSTEFWVFGGTSVGTPQWAGLVAIADQTAGHRLGNINHALYQLNDVAFHDITKGNNDFPPISGYSAHRGWDAASGLGSPVASNLVDQLAQDQQH